MRDVIKDPLTKAVTRGYPPLCWVCKSRPSTCVHEWKEDSPAASNDGKPLYLYTCDSCCTHGKPVGCTALACADIAREMRVPYA